MPEDAGADPLCSPGASGSSSSAAGQSFQERLKKPCVHGSWDQCAGHGRACHRVDRRSRKVAIGWYPHALEAQRGRCWNPSYHHRSASGSGPGVFSTGRKASFIGCWGNVCCDGPADGTASGTHGHDTQVARAIGADVIAFDDEGWVEVHSPHVEHTTTVYVAKSTYEAERLISIPVIKTLVADIRHHAGLIHV